MFEGWVAAAAVVGAGVAGSAISASGAKSAANAQAGAAENAQQISMQQYNDTVNRNAPFTQAGYGALSALDYGLGIGPQTASGQPVQQQQQPPQQTEQQPGVPANMSSLFGNPQGGFLNAGAPSGPPAYSGNHASTGVGSYGYDNSPIGGPVTNGPAGGGAPGAGSPVSGAQGTGLGYGSLTKQFDTSDWQKLSPAYNFNVQQGQQNVLNGAASGQGALSGSAMKDLINYNQSAANNSFNNAFNQYQTQQGNIFSRLSGIAQLGQSSANNTGQQGTALAGQAAQSATNIGTAQAGGIVGSANAISGGLNSAAPWLASGSGGNPNNVAGNWDTENTSNFQDFAGGG